MQLRVCLPLLTAIFAFSACSGDTTALPDSGTAPACTSDPACGDGRHCEAGQCVADCSAANPCGTGSVCGDDGRCTAADCTVTGCPDGRTCDAMTGLCTDTSTGTACSDDDECEDEQVCVQGTCGPEIGCVDSSDCDSELRCIDQVCRDPCEDNDDCGSARFLCNTMTGECQARCIGDGTCPSGFICEMNVCVDAECEDGEDCEMNEQCAGADEGHGRCEEFTACTDPADCPDNFECNAEGRCEELPICVGDRGCDAAEFCDDGHCQPALGCAAMTCPSGFDCVADRCVPGACRGLEDCELAGEICVGGTCQAPPAPTFVTEVRIITPAGVVRPASTYAFVAVALDQAGDVVPGVRFTWASTSTAIASIDAGGVATGGDLSGTTQITASVSNGTSIITSAPVRLTNLGPLAAGEVRVTVVGLASGDPVSGATVQLDAGAGGRTGQTDAQGVLRFPNVDAAARFGVTVSHGNFDWVTLTDTATRDLLIALPPLTRPDLAGGLKGPVDLSGVSSTGALYFSLSGASFASPLFTTESNALFGSELFTVHVPVPGGNGFDVPIGASSTVQVDFMGTPISLKDTYYARARSGLRAAWSFGGRIAFRFGGGGGGAPGDILGAALPYFQTFEHDVRPTVSVLAVPTVIDLADIDGDGDTSERVPDYNRFATVPLRPDTAQSLRFQLRAENARLPFVADGNANAVVVLSGALLPGIGFVPLGLDGLQDMGGTGLVPSFTTRIAPPHSGLEVGEYAVMVLALRLSQTGLPGPGSARLVVTPQLPTTVDVSDGWIDSPRNSVLRRATRALELGAVSGADLYHVELRSPEGAWHVYTPPRSTPLELPAAPMGAIDRVTSATVTVDALDLEVGASADQLFSVGQDSAASIDRVTRGFSRGRVTWR